MAHEYTTWAYKVDIDQPLAKFVLVCIADAAGEEGRAFPGQKRLSRMTSMGERTVRRHLAWLEENGYIRRSERRREDGSRTSDEYFLPPKDTGGQIGRWGVTGQIGRTPRPNTTSSPATVAGHELPEEPPVEPSEEEEGSVDFDRRALSTLKTKDRAAFDRLEKIGGSLKWGWRHKSLAATRILVDRTAGLAALRAALKGANSSGANAYRYFERVLDNPMKSKPSAPRGKPGLDDYAARLKGDRKW